MIIAEIGHNHNGDTDIAFELIRQAKQAGADIAKFQLYETAKIVATDHRFYWDLERGQVSKEQWFAFARYCKELDIECMASAFDPERVEWCEQAGVKRYKIASRSIYDVPLLEAVAATGKPIIISLGKVKENRIPKINGAHVDYLYCIAQYPTPLSSLKLLDVDFNGTYAGFSDHTVGIEAALVALSRGARIIEKHFTLDKHMDGCDHACSITPPELKALIDFSKTFEAMK